MDPNNHILISDKSEAYANRMCDGDASQTFNRGDIAAAYIIGAETTLHRICNAIQASVFVGGLSKQQSQTLLRIIEKIENTPDATYAE